MSTDQKSRMPDIIPFNVSYTIPDGSLRAVPDNPDEMCRAVEWMNEQAALLDDELERARTLGLGGAYAGMLREFDLAQQMLDEAISLADTHDAARLQVTCRIRLADILAGSGDPNRAVDLLRRQLDRCKAEEPCSVLIDFTHQHLGKALLEVGDIPDGTEHLLQTLQLRQQKGDAELIASTEQALQVACEMVG